MKNHPAEFTVMQPYTKEKIREYGRLECPRSIPWEMVAPHEKQAITNHGQTLERLNERGGLDPCELVAVLTGTSLSRMDPNSLVPIPILRALLDEFVSRKPAKEQK